MTGFIVQSPNEFDMFNVQTCCTNALHVRPKDWTKSAPFNRSWTTRPTQSPRLVDATAASICGSLAVSLACWQNITMIRPSPEIEWLSFYCRHEGEMANVSCLLMHKRQGISVTCRVTSPQFIPSFTPCSTYILNSPTLEVSYAFIDIQTPVVLEESRRCRSKKSRDVYIHWTSSISVWNGKTLGMAM